MKGPEIAAAIIIVVGALLLGSCLADSFAKKRKKVSKLKISSTDSATLELFERWKHYYETGWRLNFWWAMNIVFLVVPVLNLAAPLFFIGCVIGAIYNFGRARKFATQLGFEGRNALKGRLGV